MGKIKLYDRCMGACCEDIGLKVSPEKFKKSYLKWFYKKKTKCKIYTDVHIIYPAFEYIKKDYFHPEYPKDKSEQIVYHYRCKLFDKKNRKCTIYHIRPWMCRVYPRRGKFCNNPKCRWKKQIKLRGGK